METLTAADLEMLNFPAGIHYDPVTGRVTADSADLLTRAHGLLRLGAFRCRKLLCGAIKVYGATPATHSGYGSVWARWNHRGGLSQGRDGGDGLTGIP